MEGLVGLNSASLGSVSWSSQYLTRQAHPFLTLKNSSLYRKSLLSERFWPELSLVNRGRRHVVKADMTASASTTPVAPLLPESPSGQFLAELLHSHPYLVPAAAEQQLETLAEAREAASNQELPNTVGNELILYKRIAALRDRERRKSLEDIMYALISQKFVEAEISLVPQMSSCPKNERVDKWVDQDEDLELVHSMEAFELIREHLSLVLGGKGGSQSIDQNAVAQISKLRVGRVYAASAVYGYFLRRVDKRFQLEKTIRILPSQSGLIEVEQMQVSDVLKDDGEEAEEAEEAEEEEEEEDGQIAGNLAPIVTSLVVRNEERKEVEVAKRPSRYRRKKNSSSLRSYVMSLDPETLQRYARIRSKESVSVIERHTEALFGKPEIQVNREGASSIVKDEGMLLGFSGLQRLVLEAVAFGSFLWDVESYVDTHYHIVSH